MNPVAPVTSTSGAGRSLSMDSKVAHPHHERNSNLLIPRMSDIDIRAINLNLLPALEALLEERNVSAAARRAHVSQSAMSHSLSKLRELFGDPLLAPSGRALVLTPQATRIARSLSTALDRLGASIAPSPPFDPRTTRRTFRVATLDYFELTVLGDLLAHLEAHAPGARLEIDRFSASSLPALAAGEIDLALVGDVPATRTAGLCRRELHSDPFSVMLRPGHPALAKKKLSLEAYLELKHVLVSVEGRGAGVVDRALERRGARRQVVLRVPHFMSAPLAVLQSDCICTIARSVAERARELFGIELRAPPIELPDTAIVALWSKRVDEDDGGRWFRNLFVDRVVPVRKGRR